MKRRECIAVLGAVAIAWPLVARALQAAGVPRIGWIAIGTPQGSEFFEAVSPDHARREAFLQCC